MRHALALAQRGWGHTSPNPMVGAVLARDGEVVGEGWHQRFGEAHAEVNALAIAGDRARGATLYVSLEPCNHWGKTPPCAKAIVEAGVGRVVFAASDPGSASGGGGAYLSAHGVSVSAGVCEHEARELNAPFFHSFTSDRPWVTLKLALSLDGAIADEARSGGWLTNEASRAAVHRMRANSDAIAVGAETYLGDLPQLTVRGPIVPRVAPLRVVFDRKRLLESRRTVVPDATEADGLVVIHNANVADALLDLRSRGVRSLLVEGGAGLASDLLDADVVDRLVIFQAPIIVGRGALHAFASAVPRNLRTARRLPVLRREELGDDLMTIFAARAV